ncbi:MAG TPA: MFS transporter, partial [Flavobacteriales bacterium]|nr:MFS transporter [Flavobacteriales bacterium]
DFMVMAPLGAMLMPVLSITPGQFSHVVSGYAFAAGISGLLAAGFADKYDRKKLLLFFYIGFVGGTLFCGLAPTYGTLLAARVITGIFGGVVGSVSMAIITDVFAPQVRGRVMGYVQLAFALSQVAGIPLGVFLATRFDWHAPFLLIVGFATVAGLVIFRYMRPVAEHLALQHDRTAFQHLLSTFLNRKHTLAFLTMMILATGGFMMMPFSTAFLATREPASGWFHSIDTSCWCREPRVLE